MTIAITDHRIHWFYPFHLSERTTLELPLACGKLASLLNREDIEPKWELTEQRISADIPHHVRSNLGYAGVTQHSDDNAPPQPDQQERYGTLELQGIAPLAETACLELYLPHSAQRRLAGETRIIGIAIESVLIFRFVSGIGILCLVLNYRVGDRPPAGDEILEANHLASHLNTERKLLLHPAGQADGGFEPVELIRSLIGLLGSEGLFFEWNRTFIYSALATDDSPPDDEQDAFAQRLARKFTADYEIENYGIACLPAFKVVHHYVAQEGAATIVRIEEDAPVHVRQFLHRTIPTVYLPLLIVALHENWFFLSLFNRYSQTRFNWDKPGRGAAETLRTLEGKLARYRQHFLYGQVSTIAQHVSFFKLVRTALGVDEMREEIEATLHSGADLVQRYNDARWKKYAFLGAMFAVFIGANEIAGRVVDNIFNDRVLTDALNVLLGRECIQPLQTLSQRQSNWVRGVNYLGRSASIILAGGSEA